MRNPLFRKLGKCSRFPPSRHAASRRSGRTLLRLERLEDRLVPSDGTALGTVLVKDILPGGAGSSPSNLADVNGTLFFAASDGTSGVELWKSNGTATGTVLVKDIQPGAGGSYPRRMANVNGTLFFVANDGTTGYELWKSDGTTAGTVLVKDIQAGIGDSFPGNLTNVNGTLFFSADDGTHGRQLWKSDGTATGTVMVKDLQPGGISSGDQYSLILANVNGTLFFRASDGTTGTELWKSDGTAAGTVLVKDIQPGTGSSSPSELMNVNGTLFLRADDGTTGQELWKSDGTAAGTVLVKDIYTGISTSNSNYYHHHSQSKYPNSSSPHNLTNVNGTLYFAASEANHGTELWKSDGTATGTVLVKDIRQGKSSSEPQQLTNVNGTLFFAADDGTTGRELWKSDGTATGTVLVKDINPGTGPYGFPLGSYPASLTNASGTLYFSADDGTHGRELWKSNGTAAGTVLVADINPGTAASIPASLTVSGGHLFFSADDGVHGRELWDPPILPLSGTDTVQTAEGIRSSGDSLALSAPSDGGDAGAGILSTTETPMNRQRQDGMYRLADDPTGSAPARAADNRPTDILDQVFAEAATHSKMSRFGLAPDRLWNPDLPEDLAISCQLR